MTTLLTVGATGFHIYRLTDEEDEVQRLSDLSRRSDVTPEPSPRPPPRRTAAKQDDEGRTVRRLSEGDY